MLDVVSTYIKKYILLFFFFPFKEFRDLMLCCVLVTYGMEGFNFKPDGFSHTNVLVTGERHFSDWTLKESDPRVYLHEDGTIVLDDKVTVS